MTRGEETLRAFRRARQHPRGQRDVELPLVRPDVPWFWLFTAVILAGSVVESMRNIALSTTVTLLVPEDGRDRAYGLVGTVQGIAFMITSVFSGLSIGGGLAAAPPQQLESAAAAD